MRYNIFGDSMSKDRYIDLSDIKDDELDKTASFTDLMSRSERKAREKAKKQEKEQKQNDDILNFLNESEQEETTKNKELNSKAIENEPLKNTIRLDKLDKPKNIIDRTIDISSTTANANNIDEEINDNSNKKIYKIGNIIINGIFIIISIIYYIYSIVFTTYQNNERYLLIDSAILLSMIILFCISIIAIISNKKVSKCFSIINYIVFLGFVVFNILINIGYIK